MESFKYNPDKKAEILAKYETLTKGKIRSKSLTPKKKAIVLILFIIVNDNY